MESGERSDSDSDGSLPSLPDKGKAKPSQKQEIELEETKSGISRESQESSRTDKSLVKNSLNESSQQKGILKNTSSGVTPSKGGSTVLKRNGSVIMGDGDELLKVYLMDNSYKAMKIDTTNTTVEELWEIASDKLMLTPQSATLFFIWGIRSDLELLLFTHQKIGEVFRDWKMFEDRYNPPEKTVITKTISKTFSRSGSLKRASSLTSIDEPVKLVFRMTSVLPLKEELKFNNDHSAVHLFYIQAVHNVIFSNYPCSIETAIKLGGIQLQLTLGNKTAEHKPGYLQDYLSQYIPEHLLGQKKPEELEASLSSEHASNKDKDKHSLELDYLALVRQWKHYGCVFFKAKYFEEESVYFKQEWEGKVRIGVNQNGIHIVDPKAMKIIDYPFKTITDWDSDQTVFFFEAKVEDTGKGGLFSKMRKKEGKLFRFKSKQSELINDLVCDWMSELESEVNTDKRKKRASTKKQSTVPVDDDDFSPV